MNKKRLSAYLMLLLVSVIWGVAGPVIKFTLADFPPLIFLTYRFAISSMIAFIFWRGLPKLPKKPERVSQLFIYSFLAVPVTLGLLFWGYSQTSSLEGTLISSIAPLFGAIVGAWYFREHITKIERIGMALALGGTLLTVAEPLIRNHSPFAQSSFGGNVLILLAMFTEAIAFLFAKKLARGDVHASLVSHFSFLVGFGVIAPLTLTQYSPATIFNTILSASWQGHLGVLFMALLSGTLAYGLRNKALKTIEVSESALFAYLGPIWAAPLSILWLGESISWVFLLGAAIIAMGVFIAEYKKRRKGVVRRRKT